jgi:thiol-disulfide isomerase/thioredoxin
MVKNHYGNKISRSKNLSSIFSKIQELPSVIKDVLAKEELVNYIKYNRTQERNEALYNGIKMLSDDTSFLSLLNDKYEKVKSISKGMPSPLFIDYKNYKGGVTSLKDLQGKYVYIDVWATWCGPCIKQFPYFKQIENKYKGKNITFVSISIDKTEQHNTWFKMIKDKNLKGIQLLADNDWQSKFIKDFNIEGIPRFILIDPNGYIISPDAPSPSDPKLISLLDKLEI